VFTSILDDWAGRVETNMARQFQDALRGPDPDSSMTNALVKEARRGRYIMPIWLEFIAQATRVPKLREGVAGFHERIRQFAQELVDPKRANSKETLRRFMEILKFYTSQHQAIAG